MKLALIPPHELLSITSKSDYYLALAPFIKSRPEYRDFFRRVNEHHATYSILDNGAYEGELMASEELWNLAVTLRFDEVVVPDVLRDADATREMAYQFYARFAARMHFGPKTAFVLQGETHEEFVTSLVWASHQHWIDTLMIPRHTASTVGNLNERLILAEMAQDYSNKPIHLLGANPRWPHEFQAAAAIDNIRGMDTSMPFNYGIRYQLLDVLEPGAVDRVADYFDYLVNLDQARDIRLNVEFMLRSLSGHR